MARATQKPGQTKEQTKLISQGIQKGIEQYKNQQKEMARERDKRAKKAAAKTAATEDQIDQPLERGDSHNNKLPWILLVLSWLGFAGYFVVSGLL